MKSRDSSARVPPKLRRSRRPSAKWELWRRWCHESLPGWRPRSHSMKAFTFRLEQALRWRETQVEVQKSRVASASGRLAQTVALLEARKADLSSAAAAIDHEPTGAGL